MSTHDWMVGSRQLERATDSKAIAGVCGGIAERWRIDPLIVRIVALILCLWSGLGFVLYGLAWVLLPLQGRAQAPLFRAFPAATRLPRPVLLVLVSAIGLATVVALPSLLPISSGVLMLLTVGYVVMRGRNNRRKSAAATGTSDRFNQLAEPSGWADRLDPVVPFAARAGQSATMTAALTDWPAPSSQSAKLLRRRGLAVCFLVIAGLGMIDAFTPGQVPIVAYTSALLLVLGVTMVLSAWLGRARFVLPLALAALIATVIALAGWLQ